MGKAEVNKKRSRKAESGLWLVLLLCAGLLGWYLGLRLPEERKNRARKLMTEAREMPFRIFV